MQWTPIMLERHKGKTLPQIILSDPDWFFWMMKEGQFDNKGIIRKEAVKIDYRAQHIRIPCKEGEDLVAEYIIDLKSKKFCDLEIIPRDKPIHEGSSRTMRLDVIDLSFSVRCADYDKLGGKLLIKAVKQYVFGDRKCILNKKKCEDFFNDDSNFDLSDA